MADFYWVGSTAGTSDALRFDIVSNWRVISNPTAGASLARWTVATRLPWGYDTVYVGCPGGNGLASTYWPGPYLVMSPLLFGGVSGGYAGSTAAKIWNGVTAGTAKLNRHGPCNMIIEPSYPFSQVGGELNFKILNEWAELRNKVTFEGICSGPQFSTWQDQTFIHVPGSITSNGMFSYGLSGVTTQGVTGTWALSGNTAEGEETAVYTVRPGVTYTSTIGYNMTGTGATLSITKPSVFVGEGKYIRWMGTVIDKLTKNQTAYFRGFTAGISASQGATSAFDGSNNNYQIEGWSIAYKMPGTTYASVTLTNGGNISGYKALGAQGFFTVLPADGNGMYGYYNQPCPKGDSVINGYWAEIGNRNVGTAGGNVYLIGVTANRIAFAPVYTLVYSQYQPPMTPFAYGYYNLLSNGTSGGTVDSKTQYDVVYFDENSSAKTFIVGDSSKGTLSSVGNITIKGDLTSTSGFNVFTQPYGGLTGATAAAGASITTLGNLVLYPTILGATCTVGYPASASEQNKASSVVTVNNIYSFANPAKEWNIGIYGRLTNGTTNLYGGKLFVAPTINNDDAVTVTSMILNNDSVLDLSQAPNHRGISTTIDFNTSDARIIPNSNTLLTTNFKTVVNKNSFDTLSDIIALNAAP